MASKSPIAKSLAKVSSQIDALADEYQAVLKRGLAEGLSPALAEAQALEAVKWGDAVEKITLGGVESAIKISGVTYSGSFVRKTWLNQTFNGVSLSDKIVQSGEAGSKAVSDVITSVMRDAGSWTRRAQKIGETGLIKSDASAQILGLGKDARKAFSASGSPADVAKYQAELKKASAYIQRLKDSDAPTGNLKRAYQRVLNATESGSQNAIDKAISKAVDAKMRYNAQRIARTEGARAWGNATRNEYIDDPDIVAMQYRLSSAHVVPDICNLHTESDLYGLGAGIYPLEKGPDYPFHPGCLCNISPVFVDEVNGKGKFSPAGGDDYLESIPEGKRVAILGKTGAEEWSNGDAKWQDVAKNYNGQSRQVYTPLNPK